MRNPWTVFKEWLAVKETGEALALFRIAVGIGALWAICVPVRHDVWRLLWTNQGYLSDAPAPETVALVMAGGALAAVCLIVGLGARVAAFCTLQVCLYLFGINPTDSGAHDRYINNALWLLVLASSSATWSVDCYIRTRRFTSDRLVSAWPRYLAVFQLVMAYWATGVQKISLEWTPWGDFTALWFIVRSPLYMRLDATVMPLWFTQFATAATWLWEWGAPIWLYAFWCRAYRPRRHWANRYDLRTLWAVWGIGMHATLFALTVLGPLQWSTLSYYAALYHPDEIRGLLVRLRRHKLTSAAKSSR